MRMTWDGHAFEQHDDVGAVDTLRRSLLASREKYNEWLVNFSNLFRFLCLIRHGFLFLAFCVAFLASWLFGAVCVRGESSGLSPNHPVRVCHIFT